LYRTKSVRALSHTLDGARYRIAVHRNSRGSSNILRGPAFWGCTKTLRPPKDGQPPFENPAPAQRWSPSSCTPLGGVQDSRSMQPRIRKAHLLITHVLDSCVKLLAVLHMSSAQGRSVDRTSAGSYREDFHQRHAEDHRLSHRKAAITAKSNASASHQNTRVSYGHIPSPDGGAPVNRHSKSPIDTTRALIGRALVLMTLNPFERVAVSLKPIEKQPSHQNSIINILLHSSSPPTSPVFDVFFMRTNSQKTFEIGI